MKGVGGGGTISAGTDAVDETKVEPELDEDGEKNLDLALC